MKIIAVYSAYIWVGLLHAFFIGTCLYAWARVWLVGKGWIGAFCVALFALAFFETYWIPVFDYFGLHLTIHEATLQASFGITSQDNVVPYLTPKWWNIVFWFLQAGLALRIAYFLKKSNLPIE